MLSSANQKLVHISYNNICKSNFKVGLQSSRYILYIFVGTYIHAHTFIHKCIYIYTHTHTYIHTYINTHTHTHTQELLPLNTLSSTLKDIIPKVEIYGLTCRMICYFRNLMVGRNYLPVYVQSKK
jgi:hypothetical protein